MVQFFIKNCKGEKIETYDSLKTAIKRRDELSDPSTGTYYTIDKSELFRLMNPIEKAQLASLDKEMVAYNSERNIGEWYTLPSGRVVNGPEVYQHLKDCEEEVYIITEERIKAENQR